MRPITNKREMRQRWARLISGKRDHGAIRRAVRIRIHLRCEGLEARSLLSGVPTITEFPLVAHDSNPVAITTGPDGSLWFTETDAPAIGRITPDGKLAEFRTGITPGSEPAEITAGPDGNIWFDEQFGGIGRITPGGEITEFPTRRTPQGVQNGIAAGPDGNLWYTDLGGVIGRITPMGTITEFTQGLNAGASPNEIVAGPDGNLWFTDLAGGVGRITPAGVITEFTAGITPGSLPTGITAGPDGNLWFTEQLGRIGRITPGGVVTEFSAGITADSTLADITAGPDGNLWFTEQITSARIGRITLGGTITEFSSGITARSGPNGITVGPDGKLWFTEVAHGIARADLHMPAPGAPATITEFPVLTPASDPQGITVGPDGNLWFTEADQNSVDRNARIGRITPNGVVTEFGTGITVNSQPGGITTGPDGNLWFAEPGADRIGRITPDGVVTEFATGITPGSEPFGITAGPDGNLWFTETGGIGRITPTGTVTVFFQGVSQGSQPFSITAGPDGNLWFAEAFGGVGRIATTGVVTEFPTAEAPSGITAGPDGNLWFTEVVNSHVGRITPTGVVTEFTAGITAGSHPAGITAGPDGNLWFTELGGRIGRITPAGTVTEFATGITAGSNPNEITTGPDGNLWFTETQGNQIGRLTPPGPVGVATTTLLESSELITVLGDPITLKATVVSLRGTPAGTVAFWDGATLLGRAPLDGTGHALVPAVLGVGVHDLTAIFEGNATFTASTSPSVTETVNNTTPANTAVALTSSANPAVFGQTERLTATVNSPAGTPTGTVTFRDGATLLGRAQIDGAGHATLSTSLDVGVHRLTASFEGNDNFAASNSPPLAEAVNSEPTTAALVSSVNPGVIDGTELLTATITTLFGTPTGSVTFFDGTTPVGNVTLNAVGQAVLSVSLSVGEHRLSVSYQGTRQFAGSTSPAVIETVNPSPSITRLVASPSSVVPGQSLNLTAMVAASTPGVGTPTGTVTFSDGNSVIGTAAVGADGAAALTTHFLTTGVHVVTATYNGDQNVAASAQAAGVRVLNGHPIAPFTTTTLIASTNVIRRRHPVVITALVRSASRTAVKPTGTVTFMVGNVAMAQIKLDARDQARWIVRFPVPGKLLIRAVYSGDSNFAGSSQVLRKIVV